MITIIKRNPQGEATVQYQGEIIKHFSYGIIIEAIWTGMTKDLGYTSFEPGDHFTEYFYTDRWFNIFDIRSTNGLRKGWYCNVTEPAILFEDHIEQVDLILDVWVNPTGEALLLDEDEFAASTTLSNEQRSAAQQGLRALLHTLATRQEAFSAIADT